MTRYGRRRVVVGVDGSPQSLAALREAVAQARCRRAALHVVHARRPVKNTDTPHVSYFDAEGWAHEFAAEQQRRLEEAAVLEQEGRAMIAVSLDRAVGGVPADIEVNEFVSIGKPERALLAQAWSGDDLIVVGTRGGHRWRHPRRRSVSRYCAGHAPCPVLVVPPEEAAEPVSPQTPHAGTPATAEIPAARSGGPRELAKT
jgi:nucleotide-binding universal stress UspA family protein